MRLPLLSGKQVFSALKRLGFVEVHRFTLGGALKDADVSIEEFLDKVR